ncbi:MAG: hypothetical protein EOP40_05525 [Rubrivivax sp.]|nr:MAG: hypothetical protein EOP40_05525 [Rubrivivax sp.]
MVRLPQRLSYRLPSHLINGLSVGTGLVVVSGLIAAVAGAPAAFAASSGASVVSVADTVTAPQAKPRAMRNAVISSTLVALMVALTSHHPWWLGLTALLVTFASIFWTAWGKRGGPQTFVMILTLVFQMAAYSDGRLPGAAGWQHLGWVLCGALGMAGWSTLSGWVLAQRYRTLGLADAMAALARLMREQALWTQGQLVTDTPLAARDENDSLLALVRQQASIADVFQQARDLLYSAPDTAKARRQAAALVHLVDMRDVSLVFQLDLEHLSPQPEDQAALKALVDALEAHAALLDDSALELRRGFPRLRAAVGLAHVAVSTAASAQAAAEVHAPAPGALAGLLSRRLQHLARHQAALQATCARQTGRPIDEQQQDSPGLHLAALRSMVSPTRWPLSVLTPHQSWQSPVMRHAARTTAAMACAYGLSHALPWTSHPHWLLMTVAVVLRGNLEQTLLRRNARVIGTLIGCGVAAGLMSLQPDDGVLMGAMAIALSLAHGYALIDYRITSAAGAVLALTQSHLALGAGGRWVTVERIADTLIGTGLAWAFSYLWPSWEKAQLPRLIRRLVQAQMAYANLVMTLPRADAIGGELSQARREVYDVLWLLAQTLQRLNREPRRVRPPGAPLESLLVHSHRLVSHLAGINGLVSARRAELDMAVAEPAMAQARQALAALWAGTPSTGIAATAEAEGDHTSTAAQADTTDAERAHPLPLSLDNTGSLPDPHGPPTPWLLRRIHLVHSEAAALAQATQALRQQAA